jgi:hypothetical protein
VNVTIYQLRRWWLRRSLAVCNHRLRELDRIVERERQAVLYHEQRLNAALRDLEVRRHFDRLAKAAR